VIEALRGEDSVAAICRKHGIQESLFYKWNKEFLEAGKKRLAAQFHFAQVYRQCLVEEVVE
jgi:transposase-like protein